MSPSIQLLLGSSMYNFLLAENSVSSELLENLNVALKKKLTQSKKGAIPFDFKMKLGSSSVNSRVLGEILLYVTAVGQRIQRRWRVTLRHHLQSVSIKQHILSVWGYIDWSVSLCKMWVHNWKFKKRKSSSCCGFWNESTNIFEVSPLGSVFL